MQVCPKHQHIKKIIYSAATSKGLEMLLSVIRSTVLVIFLEILNLACHQNCNIGSKVTAILLIGRVWPIGEVASERVCACSLRSMVFFLVFFYI